MFLSITIDEVFEKFINLILTNMKHLWFVFLLCVVLQSCTQKSDNLTKEMEKSAKGIEFADSKYIEKGKKSMDAFASGNIEDWANEFSDNAVYLWSNGDSIKGKDELLKYWTVRRTNVIDTYKYGNDFWLPIKVTSIQKGLRMNGVWLFSWFEGTIKYKNGKTITLKIHNDYHFDSSDKIDRIVHYVDREQINKVLASE